MVKLMKTHVHPLKSCSQKVRPLSKLHVHVLYILCSVPIAEVKQLVFGKDCPHMKRNKGIIAVSWCSSCFSAGIIMYLALQGATPPYDAAFSLIVDEEKRLDFVAPDERTVSALL